MTDIVTKTRVVEVVARGKQGPKGLDSVELAGDRAYSKSGYVGGNLPIIARVSTTEISIGGGVFSYKDLTDPLNILSTSKTFEGVSVYTMVTIPPALIAYIYLDVSDMTIKEVGIQPSIKSNSWVYLGNVDYDNGDIFVNSFIETAYSLEITSNSLLLSSGNFNLSGLDYYGKGGLLLGHTEGTGIRIGASTATNPADPDRALSAVDSVALVVKAYTNSLGALVIDTSSNAVDPTMFSDKGVLTTVAADRWTVQYLYHFYGSDVVVIYYGTKDHKDLDRALAAITSPLDIHGVTKEAVLRSAIVVRGGATDLTLDTDALIFNK